MIIPMTERSVAALGHKVMQLTQIVVEHKLESFVYVDISVNDTFAAQKVLLVKYFPRTQPRTSRSNRGTC